MKQLILTGILAGALGAAPSARGTQPGQSGNQPSNARQTATAGARGQAAGKTAREAGTLLATVQLPRAVKADGKPLPAGTYQLRLTDADAAPPAGGASPNLEKWVEFVQGGQVKGREVCSIFPNNDLPEATEDRQSPPRPGQAKVQMLKGNEYLRIWVNKGGNSYLLHLPPA